MLRIEARLLKPVPQDELFETIARVMDRPGAGPRGARPPTCCRRFEATPHPGGRGQRVRTARHIERLLVRQGHSVRLAKDGRETLAILGIMPAGTEAAGGGRPRPSPAAEIPAEAAQFDVLLLDLRMPELDGFLVALAIREREGTDGEHLPIIALTARSRREDREHCLRAGMDEYLSKPARTAELFAAIDRAIGGGPRVAPAEGGAYLLDPVVLLGACGDDAEGLRALPRLPGVCPGPPRGGG